MHETVIYLLYLYKIFVDIYQYGFQVSQPHRFRIAGTFDPKIVKNTIETTTKIQGSFKFRQKFL